MSDFQLALLQHQPTPGDIDTSLARINQYAAEASDHDMSLLLVPEASMTGYNISLKERDLNAQTANGKLRDNIATLCSKHQIAIAYGYIEKDGESYFNSVQLIDKTGNTVNHYRKTHLWGDLDRTLFQAGKSFSPIVHLDDWKVALLICYDVEFPETVRHLALQGAEVILVPTALMSPWTDVADLVVPTRAYENQVYLAYANYCGSENNIDYVGHSCIAAPDGKVLCKAGTKPELLKASFTKHLLQSTRQALPYHRDRRPELYMSLSTSRNV